MTDKKQETTTFTVLPHDVIDTLAARLLSPGGFRLLVDFLRVWLKATRNGARKVASVRFTWSTCDWPCRRETWNKHRAELVEHGFIDAVDHRGGEYRASGRFRKYQSTEHEERRLEAQAKEKAERATCNWPCWSENRTSIEKPAGTESVPACWSENRTTSWYENRTTLQYGNTDNTSCALREYQTIHAYALEGWINA